MEKTIIKFSLKYCLATISLLLIEVAIALNSHDNFIRSYMGDVLVIILLYTGIKSLYYPPTKRLPYYLFAFACLIEMAQWMNLVSLFGLSKFPVATTILGSVFDLRDVVAYLVGMVLLLVWEQLLRQNIAYL